MSEDEVPASSPGPRLYRFGDFTFDVSRSLLFKGSETIPVPERLALILTQLLQANGRLVTKEALALSIWPNEAVSDANLTQHIYMLRQLFGDKAKEHTHILAVPRRGYRFALPIQTNEQSLDDSLAVNAADLGEIVAGAEFDAFCNYCQGSFLLAKRTAPAVRRALEFFERGLASTPHYVPALIGLARAHSLLGTYWYLPPHLTFPLGARAVEGALRIDPGNAVAHSVRAGILSFGEWSWQEARAELDLAIKLNPGSASIRNNAAWLDVCMGRFDDALVQARLALALEPASLLYQLLIARVLVHYGRYDQAIAIMTNIIETDEAFYVARRYRAQAYLLAGSPERALNDLEALPQERSEDLSFRLPMLGRAFADLGDSSRALEVYDLLCKASRSDYVVFWNLALVAIGIGRHEEALDYLAMACEQREATLPFLKSLPWFTPIAHEERFSNILKRVGP